MLTKILAEIGNAKTKVLEILPYIWTSQLMHVYLKSQFVTCCLLCIDLILYIPVINFSVMLGQVFLGWTSTKQG